jgi:hypothetical protein
MKFFVRHKQEVALVLVIFLCSAVLGMAFVNHWGGTASYYQQFMGPSLMFALGQGFHNPDLSQLPEVESFLFVPANLEHPPKVNRFDPALLPDNAPTRPFTSYQVLHSHLLFAAGLCWWLFGVSWTALLPLFGVLYGVSTVAFYGLFRQGMNRVVSVWLTVLMALSSLQLNNLPRLRDYGKAPFILAAMVVMVYLLRAKVERRRFVALSALMGVVLGVGYGFRMDTLMPVPLFLVLLVVFCPGEEGTRLPFRVLGAVAMVATFFLSGWVPHSDVTTSHKYDHTLQGFADIYDQRLGLGGAPYDVAHAYLDTEPLMISQADALHTYGEQRFYTGYTEVYETAGKSYMDRLLRYFPADFFCRAWAAVFRTVDELGPNLRHPAPNYIESPALQKLFHGLAWNMNLLTRYARYAVPFALFLIALRNLRLAVALLFMLAYLGGYSSLQFASRHNFQFQCFSVLAGGFLLSMAWRGACWLRREGLESVGGALADWKAMAGRGLAFVVVALLVSVVPLQALRLYQSRQVAPLLGLYEGAEREALRVRMEARDGGDVLARVERADGQALLRTMEKQPDFDWAMLVAEFGAGEEGFDARPEYDISAQAMNFSYVQRIPGTSAGSTFYFFPVYAAHPTDDDYGAGLHGAYRGLVLPEAGKQRLKGICRVTNTETLPLVLSVVLGPNWREEPLYQHRIR